ncbi:hypothetical protein [Candidatus Phyllobacterium onerii]|uniref:hypothetical protein n=1 Tax=Candidatus Phyllobacterium onerii TaxID=3020828 RepID=UPI00232D73C5|nr:hypothetical protein [Phyllobacterium sp. IY22]
MAQIKGPVLPAIHPKRWLDCERALQERFTAIAEKNERRVEALKELIVEAIEAGWTEPEVKRALVDMIEATDDTGKADGSCLRW